jgi:hypothetical protein
MNAQVDESGLVRAEGRGVGESEVRELLTCRVAPVRSWKAILAAVAAMGR